MTRKSGHSVRLKLTLSYAGFLMVAGALLLTVVWVYLLRYVPDFAPQRPDGGAVFIIGPTRSDLLDAFLPKALLVLAGLLILGLVGGWLLAGRMLAPLDRITAAARAVSSGTLSRRIHLEGRRDEFRELADTFDAMLERLDSHVAEQQRFAANASHELRTPLAITQTLLDVAQNSPDGDLRAVNERLRTVNTRAIELTEALLVLSRAEQRSFLPEDVDLSLIAEGAAETLLPVAEKQRVQVHTSGDRTHACGSPTLLLQLTTNLLHNAIVHNLPQGGDVWITTTTQAGGALLTVENTGEQLNPAIVATLDEPFQRGNPRTRTDHQGVGLGLAIVKSIATAHHGTLTLKPRSEGGLIVRVRLPKAQ